MSRFGDMTVFGKVRSTCDADGSGQCLLDLVERIVGPDAGVEGLRGFRRPMTKGMGYGFNRLRPGPFRVAALDDETPLP